MSWLKKIDQNFEEYLVIFFLTIMTVSTLAQVIFRFVIQASLDWSEELARYSFLWCMFISTGMAVKHKRHIKVEFGVSWMPKRIRGFVEILADLIWMAFCLVLVKDGIDLLGILGKQLSPSMELSYKYVYSSLPVGAALMFLRLAQQMYLRLRPNGRQDAAAVKEA